MGRDPRVVPAGSLQHVVDTVFQNRALLRPSEEVNRMVAGVLGRAQRTCDMPICAVVVLSAHLHLLLRPRDAAHLAAFMCFVKTNLAKEIGRLHDWKGGLFRDRYRASTVADRALDQEGILRYVLGHGVKEGLVAKVRDWPGVHCADSLTGGPPIRGEWRDRSAEHRQPKEGAEEVTSEEEIRLTPLPCWESWTAEEREARARELVADAEARAAAARAGRPVWGAENVCAVRPQTRLDVGPLRAEGAAQPRFHTSCDEVRRRMKEAWDELVAAYRRASKELREGNAERVVREKWFPQGMFPPALAFVSFDSAPSVPSHGVPSHGATHLLKNWTKICAGRGRPE